MDQRKLKAIEAELSGTARKVLDAVPIADAWQVHTIVGELKRLHGSAPSLSIVSGCLESLRHSGLVQESRGRWIRRPVKERTPKIEAAEPVEDAVPSEPEPRPSDSRDKSPREMLTEIAVAMMDLAVKLEDVGAAIEAADKRADEKTAKLRQLQELLRGLGT
jgi:hypothetical protein